MKIIGISGKKQSGKTTAAMFLNRMTPSVVVPIADGIKSIVKVCFGATEEQINGTDEQKNTLLPCEKTAREVMQLIGTDWFRELDDRCWIMYLEHTMHRYHPQLFIIPDVRFANEVQFIQEGGEGHVIRLLRAPFANNDAHISETELDDAPEGFFDAVIDNRAMSVDEQNAAVWELVCERKWI